MHRIKSKTWSLFSSSSQVVRLLITLEKILFEGTSSHIGPGEHER